MGNIALPGTYLLLLEGWQSEMEKSLDGPTGDKWKEEWLKLFDKAWLKAKVLDKGQPEDDTAADIGDTVLALEKEKEGRVRWCLFRLSSFLDYVQGRRKDFSDFEAILQVLFGFRDSWMKTGDEAKKK